MKFTLITVVFEFMNQTMTYLDGLDWIERYAWFGYFVGLFSLNFAAFSKILVFVHDQRPRPDVHYSKVPPSIFMIHFNSIHRPVTRRRGLEPTGRTLYRCKNCPYGKHYRTYQHV